MDQLSKNVKNSSVDTEESPNATRKSSKRRRPDTKTQPEEQKKEKEEEKREKSCGDGDRNNGISIDIDHKVLDCPLCFNPLRPPIFQCTNGHVACSPCCDKLKKVCQVCSLSTRCIRCRALESVIESIKVPCSYLRFGCKETISYTQKHIHEESCSHAPCYCPFQQCTFHGTTQGLSDHFSAQHRIEVKDFLYSHLTLVLLDKNDPFDVLRGEDGRLFLLLNGRNIPSGNSLSLACIKPGSMVTDLEYELTVPDRFGNKLSLKGSPTSIRQWGGDYPTKCFLYVPHEFAPPREAWLVVDLKIKKTTPFKVDCN